MERRGSISQARLATVRGRRVVFVFALTMPMVLFCSGGCESGNVDQNHSPEAGTVDSAADQFHLNDVAMELGINLRYQLPQPDRYHMPDIMGYGCAALDADRDGDVDLIFAVRENQTSGSQNSTAIDDSRRSPSDQQKNAGVSVWPGTFYRQAPTGRFEKMTDRSDDESGTPMGIATGDVNNDGWPDVYMTCFGEDQLFLNREGKGFEKVTEAAGISNPRWGTSACFVDYDRDGWLDLYVTNYVDYFPQKCVQLSGVNQDFCGPQRFKATRDCLFRNTTAEAPDGTVQFKDVTTHVGMNAVRGKGLGVAAADFTGDGWQDIYVANDQEPNFLWVNQQDGTYREEAILLGCATDHLGNSQASMGLCIHDFDDDGRFDILVTHIDGERNTLYVGTREADFRDATLDSPICRQSFDQTGFGVATMDLDGDGVDELVVANGRVRRPDGSVSPQRDFWEPYRQPAMIHSRSGAFPLLKGSSLYRGLVASDLDDDGDRDVILTSIDQPPVVVRNELPVSARSNLSVHAILPKLGGRDALGATVLLKTNTRQTSRLIQTCGSYLSASMPVAEFSLLPDEVIKNLTVVWPDGERELFSVPSGEGHVRVEQGRGTSIQ